MARLRYNGLTATLGADLLTADTTITFAAALSSAAGAVPTITGTDYIPLAVLDTDGSVLEIIHLTAYTTGATTGTVTRAQESTTAADRAAGLTAVNGITVADATEFASGATFAGCRLIRSAAYTVPNGTPTALPWDAESHDTDAFHDTATNPSRITIPTGLGGYYHIGGTFGTSTNLATGGRFSVAIAVNGSWLSGTEFETGGFSSAHTATDILLAAGDYVELIAYVNKAGVALHLGQSNLYCHRLG